MVANPAHLKVPEALRSGQRVRDSLFDLVYPEDVRRVSARFWTPVEIARTAGRWLKTFGCHSVLDIGSGPGKFCIVANLCSGLRVVGLEQRESLVTIARAAAAAYGAQVEFLHGTLETLEDHAFDAFYLFNPFGENLYEPSEQFDAEAELSALRFMHDTSIVEHWLDHAPAGSCMLTYHGFGGRIPATFELRRSISRQSGQLRLWRKRRAGPADAFFLEVDGALELTAAK